MKPIHWILWLSLALAACSTSQEKPERKWDVKVTTAGPSRVWVAKNDGSLQCEPAKGALTPAAAMQEAKQAGLKVFQARAGSDGMNRITLCGAETGKTVEIEVARSDLEKAESLGYRLK